VLLLPNFQRSLWPYQPPLLIGVAKVRAFIILPNLFSDFYQKLLADFLSKNSVFKRVAKVSRYYLVTNFILKKIKVFFIRLLKELASDYHLLFSKAGCKNKRSFITTKYFFTIFIN